MPTSNPVALGQGIGCKVYHSMEQSIAHNVNTVLLFNSERFDTDNLYTPAASGRLTCNTAGVYLIGGTVAFALNSTGARQIFLALNGITPIASEVVAATNSGPTVLTLSTIYALSVGDFVQLLAYQNSGAALNAINGYASPEFYMYRLI